MLDILEVEPRKTLFFRLRAIKNTEDGSLLLTNLFHFAIVYIAIFIKLFEKGGN